MYSHRKQVLLFGIFALLMPLFLFKYYDFVNNSLINKLSLVGLRFYLPGLNWAIPIGLSFFSLQALGYILDVYYKRIKSEHDFASYALFISFFPYIISGPINKSSLILPQIKQERNQFDYNNVVEGLKLILWGMFMKVTIADRLGLYVNTVLPYHYSYSGSSCLLAAFLYSIQLYADFAGYSFMAIGVGKTLGFEITENFKRPYLAFSVSEFWRRWHISLSTWLKDYVYIPLGGSRCSKVKTYRNLFLTFLVSGIWHGASWTYIIWGCLHGLFVMTEKAINEQKNHYGLIGTVVKIIITFILICFTRIFSYSSDIDLSLGVLQRIFNFQDYSSLFIDTHTFFYGIIALSILFFKDFKDEYFPSKISIMHNRSSIVRWCGYVVLLVFVLLNGVFDDGSFIYANF